MATRLSATADSDAELIGSAGFDSAAFAPADRFEAWREAMAPSHDIQPVRDGSREPHVAAKGWHLDNLILTDLALSPLTYRRRPGRSGEYLLLRLYRTGQAHGVFDGADFRTRPGEVHLFDQFPECRGVTLDGHRLKSVFMPYSAVQYELGRHPAHVRLGAETVAASLLRAAIETLFANLPRTRRAESAALAAGFCGLVKGLLLSATPSAAMSSEFAAVRRDAMRRYLEQHLEEPELGVDSLCAAFGASRATVYRDFAGEGGVERFIRRRRLERAFGELASGPPDRGRVRRVAERWGFACPYHFSRAFRRQFSLWPSEVFEAGGINGAAPPAAPNRAPGALPRARASAGA